MRKSLFKRAIFQIHLWGGLAIGLYAFLIGITGSVLVFHQELTHRISPVPTVSPAVAPANLDRIREGIQAHYPGWYSWSLEAPPEPTRPWGSYILRPREGRMVYAAGDGRVVGENQTRGTWLELCEKFHGSLLIPKGRLYNGIGGLVLTLLALSGLILWWPARGEWSSALRIVRRGNWKGWNYDLHRVGGALTMGFVILFSITGSYFTWPAVYKNIAASLLPVQPKQKPAPIRTEAPRLPVDDLVAAGRRAFPGTYLVRVLVPRGNKEPVTVVFAQGNTERERRTTLTQISIHPQTGEILAVDDFRQRRAGDQLIVWMGPLHTGHFGGLGIKILWALAGLALPALFVTGFLMWCNRVLAPRLRRPAPAREAAVAGKV